MLQINYQLRPVDLLPRLQRFWELSGRKIRLIAKQYDHSRGTPVFTVQGRYTTRGWTEWTQGFEVGSALLQFDATGETSFLKLGRQQTVALMPPHVTHFGVHDHGFNNVSTYGHLWRLMNERRIPENEWERRYYELALKCSGAVQARRWTTIRDGGYIYSFNGPHSLFVDTIRSLRALAIAHQLGHRLLGENDETISLLDRLVAHAKATATYSIRRQPTFSVAHEAIFNVPDGRYRCPNSQQGYSPFTTWTRGLAWAMCGFAEQLEFLGRCDLIEQACREVCDFYIEHAAAADGVPYWDTGAPDLHRLGDWGARPADPFNNFEPVDSSAAAIAAQGLLRFGRHTKTKTYWQAGLTALHTLLDEPYVSTAAKHQGLLLHSVYHWPNRWDYVPPGARTPRGESSLWGDYHLREVALYVQRVATGKPYLKFFR